MVLLYTTLPDATESERISELLVRERLTACVNTFPIHSKYRWEGKVEDTQEIAMIIKTSETAYRDCLDFVIRDHPYEVPCVLRLTPESLVPEYSDWLDRETE